MTDETACSFVSSRGLLKSCNIRSMNPKSSCPGDLEYIKTFVESVVTSTVVTSTVVTSTVVTSLYVCCDAFQTFIIEYAPKIQIPFIVVCGDGDKTMFRDTVPQKPNAFLMFILNPYLRELYSQNMDIQNCRDFLKERITKLWNANAVILKNESSLENAIHTAYMKLKQIPIGMDYHTISSKPNHKWQLKKEAQYSSPVAQEQCLIQQIRDKMTPFYQRKIQIYSNVMLCPDRFKDRFTAMSTIPPALLHQQTTFIPRINMWKNMTEYAFVLSPFGNGMDCHRTWEALLCGCIPIVRTSVFRELFEELPVLIVDKWEDVTLQLLKQTVYEFKLKHQQNAFQYERLYLSYYTKCWNPSAAAIQHVDPCYPGDSRIQHVDPCYPGDYRIYN